MNWKKAVFQNFKLYAVTDIKSQGATSILEKIEAAYRGGADIIQLRSKELSDQGLYRLGLKIRALAERYRKLFFVNDRPDLALCLEADGLHVGQEDLPIEAIRKLARASNQALFIGKSTHSLEQALAAVREGADYIGVGPIFRTPTKPSRSPVGLDLIREVKAQVAIPFVAIGGIDLQNLQEVMDAGAERVAFVRAVFAEDNVYHAAKQLAESLRSRAVHVETGIQSQGHPAPL